MSIQKTIPYTILFFSSSLYAQGIILNDDELRTDLHWLNQQGVIQLSTSTWPLSGDEVERALLQANVNNSNQEAVLQQVQMRLNQLNEKLVLDLAVDSDENPVMQQFGDDIKAQYAAALALNLGAENWDAQLKVTVEKDPYIENDQDVQLEGSYVAGKLWNQWLIAGQIPTYWGPGHDGSLIRGDASRPVYGVTMQRAEQNAFETPWLSWIGQWQYQAFVGQLDDYTAVPDTKLIGFRLTAQPLPNLELGASRIIQWGGEGRSESLSSLWDAMVGNDNVYGDTENPSNQIAGFDARLNLQQWTKIPMGIYAQYVGEDEAGYLPSKKMYLAGVDYSNAYKNKPYQIYAEWVDTRTNGEVDGISYNHSVYTDGYYQHGYPLGHVIGGDGEMVSVGGHIQLDRVNRIKARFMSATVNQSLSANRNHHAFDYDDEIKAADITWTHQLQKNIPLKLQGWYLDSKKHGDDAGVSLGIELPLNSSWFK